MVLFEAAQRNEQRYEGKEFNKKLRLTCGSLVQDHALTTYAICRDDSQAD